jgi:hypothetical protein
MNSLLFPVGTWGTVVSQKSGLARIEKVRIDRSGTAGFIIITKEPAGTFDVWVETAEEVLEFLDSLVVRWEEQGA